ncbi:MAG: RodZ domain-containing protein [Pseudomonadota bacterium]
MTGGDQTGRRDRRKRGPKRGPETRREPSIGFGLEDEADGGANGPAATPLGGRAGRRFGEPADDASFDDHSFEDHPFADRSAETEPFSSGFGAPGRNRADQGGPLRLDPPLEARVIEDDREEAAGEDGSLDHVFFDEEFLDETFLDDEFFDEDFSDEFANGPVSEPRAGDDDTARFGAPEALVSDPTRDAPIAPEPPRGGERTSGPSSAGASSSGSLFRWSRKAAEQSGGSAAPARGGERAASDGAAGRRPGRGDEAAAGGFSDEDASAEAFDFGDEFESDRGLVPEELGYDGGSLEDFDTPDRSYEGPDPTAWRLAAQERAPAPELSRAAGLGPPPRADQGGDQGADADGSDRVRLDAPQAAADDAAMRAEADALFGGSAISLSSRASAAPEPLDLDQDSLAGAPRALGSADPESLEDDRWTWLQARRKAPGAQDQAPSDAEASESAPDADASAGSGSGSGSGSLSDRRRAGASASGNRAAGAASAGRRGEGSAEAPAPGARSGALPAAPSLAGSDAAKVFGAGSALHRGSQERGAGEAADGAEEGAPKRLGRRAQASPPAQSGSADTEQVAMGHVETPKSSRTPGRAAPLAGGRPPEGVDGAAAAERSPPIDAVAEAAEADGDASLKSARSDAAPSVGAAPRIVDPFAAAPSPPVEPSALVFSDASETPGPPGAAIDAPRGAAPTPQQDEPTPSNAAQEEPRPADEAQSAAERARAEEERRARDEAERAAFVAQNNLGSLLFGARATMGMHDLKDVERVLRIKAHYLKAIEEVDPETLPAPAYLNGYVKSYVMYLRKMLPLSPEEAIEKFHAELAQKRGDAPSGAREASSQPAAEATPPLRVSEKIAPRIARDVVKGAAAPEAQAEASSESLGVTRKSSAAPQSVGPVKVALTAAPKRETPADRLRARAEEARAGDARPETKRAAPARAAAPQPAPRDPEAPVAARSGPVKRAAGLDPMASVGRLGAQARAESGGALRGEAAADVAADRRKAAKEREALRAAQVARANRAAKALRQGAPKKSGASAGSALAAVTAAAMLGGLGYGAWVLLGAAQQVIAEPEAAAPPLTVIERVDPGLSPVVGERLSADAFDESRALIEGADAPDGPIGGDGLRGASPGADIAASGQRPEADGAPNALAPRIADSAPERADTQVGDDLLDALAEVEAALAADAIAPQAPLEPVRGFALRGLGPSVVRVLDGEGRTVFSGLLAAGAEEALDPARGPFTVRADDASAVAFRVNDQVLGPLSEEARSLVEIVEPSQAARRFPPLTDGGAAPAQ